MKIGREIKETWAEIEELQKNGALLSRCVPGDYKLVDFGKDGVIRMRFAGLHKDVREYGEPAYATWVAGDLTAKRHQMHNDWFGEYSKSDLRKWLNDELYNRLPDDLKRIIVPVLKRQVAYDADWNCYTDEVVDKIWIPSFAELFEGGYPDLFTDDESRAMGAFYWLRSAYNTNYFYYVGSSGDSNYNTASTSRALALGFST